MSGVSADYANDTQRQEKGKYHSDGDQVTESADDGNPARIVCEVSHGCECETDPHCHENVRKTAIERSSIFCLRFGVFRRFQPLAAPYAA